MTNIGTNLPPSDLRPLSNQPVRGAANPTIAQAPASEVVADVPVNAPAGPTQEILPHAVVTHSDDGSVYQAANGLKLSMNGADSVVTIPGEGTITHVRDGAGEKVVGPDGAQVQVHSNDQGDLTGYSYARTDGSHAFVDLGEMSYSFESADGKVLQSVASDNSHYFRVNNSFSPDGGKTIKDNVKEFIVDPDSTVRTKGDVQGLQISQNEIKFKNPLGATVTYDIPEATHAGPAASSSAQLELPLGNNFSPQGSLLNEASSVSAQGNGPLLAETPPIQDTPQSNTASATSETPIWQNGPTPSEARASFETALAGLQASRSADPKSQFPGTLNAQRNMLRMDTEDQNVHLMQNGLAVCQDKTTGKSFLLDVQKGAAVGPVDATAVRNENNEAETQFAFKDEQGNSYTTFSKSDEIMATSADGRLSQVAAADGSQLVAVGGQTLSISPTGEVSSQGLQLGAPIMKGPNAGLIDSVKATVAGPDGQPVQQTIPLVMNLPARQTAASFWHQLTNDPSLSKPASGPNQNSTQTPPGANTSAPASDPPIPPEEAPQAGGFYAQPGQTQQGLKPSLWNRIKSAFTGNPWDLGSRPAQNPMGGPQQQGGPRQAGGPGQQQQNPYSQYTGFEGYNPPIPPPGGNGNGCGPGGPQPMPWDASSPYPQGMYGCNGNGDQEQIMKGMMTSARIATTGSMIMALMASFTPCCGMMFMNTMPMMGMGMPF